MTTPNAYDFATRVQQPAQELIDTAMSKIEASLVGQTVDKKVIRAPKIRYIANIDTSTASRARRLAIRGSYRDRAYYLKVEGEDKGANIGQISISGYFLAEPVADIYETALHECIHLVLAENDIQDTSQQGRWHNARFKQAVELVDHMDVKEAPGVGHATRLSPAGAIWAGENLDPKMFGQGDTIHKNFEPKPKQVQAYDLRLECHHEECSLAISTVAKNYANLSAICIEHGDLQLTEKSEQVLALWEEKEAAKAQR